MKIQPNVTKTQLSKQCSLLQGEADKFKKRSEHYAARLFQLMFTDKPPIPDTNLRAHIVKLKDENEWLKKEVAKYKEQAKTARSALNSLRTVVDKLKALKFEE